MKLFRYIWMTCILIAGLSSCYSGRSDRSHILKIYNWADYIDEDVLANFPKWYKEQTGEDVQIVYQTFDINEIMLTKIERGHEDFDVVCPSEYIIERMLKKNLLLPISRDFGKTPDYIKDVSPFIQKELNKTSQPGRRTTDYAVPYMWGTTGVLYNTNMLSREDVSSWDCLWDPKNKGKVLVKDSYRDAYGTALIHVNKDKLLKGEVTVDKIMNDNSDEAIAIVEKTLKKLKPNIAGWEADFGKDMMTKGKASINMAWSGDAMWAIEEAEKVGVPLDYVIPQEGSNIWYDGWVIPKYAKNTKAASYFINYLCMPENALSGMEITGYVSSIATPEILKAKEDSTIEKVSDISYFFGPIGKAVHVNNVQYPDVSDVKHCAMVRDFGPKTKAVLEMWGSVKGNNLHPGIILIIFGVFGFLGGWMIYSKIKKYRMKKRFHKRRKKAKAKQKPKAK